MSRASHAVLRSQHNPMHIALLFADSSVHQRERARQARQVERNSCSACAASCKQYDRTMVVRNSSQTQSGHPHIAISDCDSMCNVHVQNGLQYISSYLLTQGKLASPQCVYLKACSLGSPQCLGHAISGGAYCLSQTSLTPLAGWGPCSSLLCEAVRVCYVHNRLCLRAHEHLSRRCLCISMNTRLNSF